MCPSVSKSVSQLSALTFIAKSWHNDACSQNGLPLTPNSISILGKFQFLKTIEHENLTKYIDVQRGKHERTIVVSEYYGSPLTEVFLKIPSDERLETILKIFFHCANGLCHLHQKDIVHHNLEPSNVLLDENFNVKMFNYGLFYMTRDNDDEYVSFPVGNIRYLSPERMLGNHGNPKSDIWSLALIVIELLFEISLWVNMKFSQIVRKILSYCTAGGSVLEKLAREHNVLVKYNNLDIELRNFLESCLAIQSKDRPSAEEIISKETFLKFYDAIQYKEMKKSIVEMLPIERLELTQVYYLWQLTGGDVQAELKKEGLIRSEAPILTVPRLFMLQNGKSHPIHKSQSSLFDHRIVTLNTNNLTERLLLVPKRAFYPLLHCPRLPNNFGIEMQSLPLVIRERNIEYQFYRIVLFARLLKAYPFTHDLIVEQAKIDIPPLLRGRIWACLLNVLPNGKYERIDKVTPNPTDRQIEVDIPRCHQYDDFLSSPTGHQKLKRLLKAWVTAHPQYVYWQGLDSLTAPFLITNFNDEERAFLSLYNFIPKYLHNFFLKDNSMVIKEYLTKFSQLVMFHEPKLAKHLNSINFIPELFAIPWVLTMFSHVFPLHKILHLWDKLILGDSSYPLFIGIAILKQLKGTLLESGFNECILLFSDLPDIVMETCVTDSQKMYEKTPKSVCHRKHVLRTEEPEVFDINSVELSDIQREISSRISANDLVHLLKNKPNDVIVFDLRPQNEFKRWHIDGSLNLPFTNLMLSDRRLEALTIERNNLNNKVVVVISVSHENACLFAEFLVDCDVQMVCILHNSINTLRSIVPSILVGT
ncbi:CLUMA_CG009868, isoform A [Clunio marinus]|uniref:CLUMA_CG009868, isoform A n=1 Tax=Clunio marinus TaxID=568069 RepID=A0A1J1I890_9DIPT|nr:CLUMA_CG009868, isoform A [Clunio marinus]